MEDEHAHGEHELDKSHATPKLNPFLKFAFQSPQCSQRILGESVAPGKRKGERGFDGDSDGEQEKSPSGKTNAKKVKRYDHLKPLPDILVPGLDVVFCGINPGEHSARIGHHFGNPKNHFWSCLHESAFTGRKVDPREDSTLAEQFSIGLTNLVERPTVQQTELSRKEQTDGVLPLLAKIALYRPRIVCFVGIGIADVVKAKLTCKSGTRAKATIGLQDYKMVHSRTAGPASTDIAEAETLFYAVSSTSGRVVKYQKADKIRQFTSLRELVEQHKAGVLLTTDMEIISSQYT